ncbi:SusC/RagA family TonB-linked outer membrane protein [Flavivirga spongiicola]|uniref:SusC/RagA family TonB-linked outer membrane protein n=2 Tax=Flavivirga spongiicola TaxID=421621 RepID=A0ABU7XX31_9FLAO|nr:SusC/RagA family TonB-linked outer membrane protein [Flavivirga sp. MEBiC05379]MDO5980351.1 SusC/RagA family TonB-linked outer membrane protein [Flavivirga sp. MEBiC05379]
MMRTFIFLFSITMFGFMPNAVLSQKSKIKIKEDKHLTVDQVFRLIMDQTDYNFIYEVGLFKDFPTIEVKKGAENANKLLRRSLGYKNLNVVVSKSNTIIVKDAKTIQQRQISGKVIDQAGLPIAGVTVQVKGTIKAIATNFDGTYTITVTDSQNVLVFSSLGFKDQEVLVANQTKINVVLLEDVSKLDEVVVSTGYQKISKERVTGSVQQIRNKDLSVKTAQNILSKLEGEVAGLLVDEKDEFVIRGLGSMKIGGRPLIVVDGFPITQDLSSINPNDIKDISVLRDAAAASIWGIRAANGVIVIVTKKGNRERKPTIEFSTNFAITPKYSLKDLSYAPSSSFLEFQKHRVDNEWLYRFGFGGYFDTALDTYFLLDQGQISQNEADNIINDFRNTDGRKEFEDLFRNNTYWSQYNLAFNGGGKVNTYRASLTYNKNENLGFFTGNEADEVLLNLGEVFYLNSKLKLTSNFSLTSQNNKSNGMSLNDYTSFPEYQRILDDQGDYVAQRKDWFPSFKEQKAAEGYPYNWDYNLKQEFDNKNNKSISTVIRVQTALEYDVLDYLSIMASYQFEWSNTNVNNLENENTYAVRHLVNTYTREEGGNIISHIPKGSRLTSSSSYNKAHQGRLQLNFDKSFNEGLHKVTALAGYELRQELFNSSRTILYGYNPETLVSADIPFGVKVPTTGGWGSWDVAVRNPSIVNQEENRYISYYANAGYTYNNKYTLTGSIRLDDTNLFGASEKYRIIPLYSFGGKWDIGKEDFVKDSNTIDYLSLRGTYGVNGNVDRSTSPYLIAGIEKYIEGNFDFAYIKNVKNPELRLEKVFVTNFGVDFGLFDGLLSGTVEYYHKNSQDLLSPVSFPSLYGFNSAVINVGKMENKGFDVNLKVDVARKGALKYNAIFNFSYNKNTVTEVEVPEETIPTYLASQPLLNTPLRYLYSYRSDGLGANGDPYIYNEKGQLVDLKGQTDVNGTPEDVEITDLNALVYHGTTTPKYYGSWINNISYNNFYLRTLTTFKFGHVFRNTDILNYDWVSTDGKLAHIHSDFDKRWREPGDENHTDIPRIPVAGDELLGRRGGYKRYFQSDRFIDSAAHIRFKEIILGYNFNSKLLDKIGLSKLSISAQARNLGLINFNKWDKDPESLTRPTMPTYTLNFSAIF